jgi:predicted TIM-barrel fold metal-dependent hydrolase
MDAREASELRLRDYRPKPMVRRPEHLVHRAGVPAVDAHSHLGRWVGGDWSIPDVGALIGLMDVCNVKAMVNLDGMWGDELEANLDRYDRRYPGRFATFARLDGSLFARDPRFGDRLADLVRDAVARGARGLKVWKDLGLHLRDPDDRLVLPDDARLDPVWDACAEASIPVAIHIGDPIAFFEPMDATNERLEELLENPDWWYGDRSKYPSFERLGEAFEALVARRADVVFIGAHVIGCAEDLTRVGSLLETYPNVHADIAARIAELGRAPRAASELITRHPDRFLFGTDAVPPGREEYRTHFRFLETADEHFPYSSDEIPPQGRWAVSGLGLARPVLDAVYAGNAQRLIPGLGR